jgi:CelD/BcsL family acetyltransferase involved in cellulose biosynthesis
MHSPATTEVDVEVIRTVPPPEEVWQAWDRLAVEAARPYVSPVWQVGWWEGAGPPSGRPLVLLARDADGPAGVLALWAQRTRSGVERLRILGAPLTQGTGPAARPGMERAVARGFAEALASLRPRPATLELDGVLEGRRWAALLTECWPGRVAPHWRFEKAVVAPLAHLEADSLDAWLATRSSGFRQQMRRSRRALLERGAVFRRVDTPGEIAAVVDDLLRLHRARWAGRGGSRAVDDGTAAALTAIARRADAPDRMHVELIEVGGQVVSAHLFLSAGAETTYWLGGFDDAYSRERAGLVALVNATEHAIARGATHLDLGPGRQPYKERFADGERLLDWGWLLLPGPQRPLTTLKLAPGRVARRTLAFVTAGH